MIVQLERAVVKNCLWLYVVSRRAIVFGRFTRVGFKIAINRAVLTCLALVVIVTSKKVSTCLAKVVVVTRRMPNSQPARGAAAVRPAAWIAKLLFSIQVKVAMENAQSCRAIDSKYSTS